MMQDNEAKYIKERIEDLERAIEKKFDSYERTVESLKFILEKIDDLLFRKNGGKKAIIHVLNSHESFILESKSMRRKIINHAITFLLGLISAGVVFWFAVASQKLLK